MQESASSEKWKLHIINIITSINIGIVFISIHLANWNMVSQGLECLHVRGKSIAKYYVRANGDWRG